MGIESWRVFPESLRDYAKWQVPLPCSDQNPKLKCHETRWARDFCLSNHGSCEYKIEAHFDCLEEFYPKDRVDRLRKEFKPGVLDYPTSDVYMRYRQFYVHHGITGKSGWEGST